MPGRMSNASGTRQSALYNETLELFTLRTAVFQRKKHLHRLTGRWFTACCKIKMFVHSNRSNYDKLFLSLRATVFGISLCCSDSELLTPGARKNRFRARRKTKYWTNKKGCLKLFSRWHMHWIDCTMKSNALIFLWTRVCPGKPPGITGAQWRSTISPNLGPNLGPIRFRFLRLVKLLPNVHTKSFGTHTRGSYTDEWI